jgi:hypothetical protein
LDTLSTTEGLGALAVTYLTIFGLIRCWRFGSKLATGSM